MIDYALWEVIENGASLPKTQVMEVVTIMMPITTAEEKAQRILKERATKNTERNLLKQQYENFNASSSKMLDQTFDRLQKLWNTHAVVWRNKADLDTMSMDDLYNNLKVYEPEVKGMSSSSSSIQNMAFMSSSNNNTSSTNGAVNTAHGVSTASTQDLEQIYLDDMQEMDLRWQMAMLTMRAEREYKAPRIQDNKHKESSRRCVLVETSASTDLVSCDGLGGYDWSDQAEEGPNYALMAFSSSSSGLEVSNDSTCSKSSLETVKLLKSQNEQLLKDLKKSELMVLVYKTGKFMSPTPDLSFTGLDEFVNKPVVENCKAMSSEEEPKGNPQMDLQDQGVIDSRCSRHMTGNMSYLTDYEEIDGGYVAFGGNPKGGKIRGKGIIDSGNLDFENFYFVRELKFNLFSISQMCDKKNSVLFNDTECIVLSLNFKLINASQVLLRVPRKNNIYSVDLKNIVPKGGLTCLFAKPTSDESKLWHRRIMGPNLQSDDGKKVDEDPCKETECKDQDKEDNVNSTNNVNTISSTVNDAGTNKVNVDDGIISSELLFDPNMPALEDVSIFDFSNDDENDSAMADMNNLDTTIQVRPTPTTRIHKDHPFDQKKPKKVIHALKDLSWIEAIEKKLLQFKLQEVWTLVDLPNRKRAIGSKCVFRNKKDERGIVIRNKARLVSQGYTQEERIDYDEVFAPVARFEAIRLFLAYASFKDFVVCQMDVKSVFLYRTIKEEVYICQPLGFEDLNFPDRVYKVEKALYVLHQAPRAWYETLPINLLDNRFQRGKINKTLFIKRHKGELTFFLGLQVKQKKDGIFISQDKYVAEILNKFRFTEVKTASTPIETQKPLLKGEDGKEVDVHMYRSMIGLLMYLTSSRPDIMFVVCACARYQVNPKASHLHVVKRIFRYLKGQPKFGLWYLKDSPFDLVAYTDSDYARASLDRKSTIGGCQLLGCRLISWQCKKQTVVVNSTTEAEYMAASSCCRQFWSTAKAKTINGEAQIHAKVDGKKIIVIESSVRRDLRLADEEDEAVHKELCDKLKRVLDLENTKTTPQLEIASLKRRVKNLEKKNSLDEDVSKQERRIDVIDAYKEITLVNIQDDVEMFDVNVLDGEEVFVARQNENVVEEVVDVAQVSAAATTITITTEEINLAQALKALKTSKPKVKGVVIQEPIKSTTTTTIYSKQSQDKGKGIMVEEHVKSKKKDQIRLDEEVALKLQAEFNKEIDVDRQLAKRLQVQEQEELSDAEKFPPTDRSDFTHEAFANELAHIIFPPEYDCFYFRNFLDSGEWISILNSGIHENLSFTPRVNLPVEDDHSSLLAYAVSIFLAYLTYLVIPPYLHSFGNEDTIFDPGIAINRFYSF
uniref:Uncharacterized protein n=1 Tax=Tanacetum cinerariifolium TaxID=118510 RepID=A0A6L2N2H1_TANCI|nr:hypothetical protein [Tanacetum cinerariifolium]